MPILPTLVIVVATSLPNVAQAQSPGDDTTRAHAVRQTGSPWVGTNDSAYRRAEQLVREGRGDAGRALVDSLLARTRPGTPQHGQALYWRASLAADAAEAERGYRRVIIEYPVSRWSGDALLNLAQLELARGDQEQALLHLNRFEREHPRHESRARANFWLARLYFDRKNEARGCASLATARVGVSPEDIELRNQIDYFGQRCLGVDTTEVTKSVHARSDTGVTPAPLPATTPETPPSVPAPVPTPVPTPVPASVPASVSGKSTPDASVVPESSGSYTVQIAAYDTRAAAEAFIARLKARGYTARLATTARPFRVRIGRYDSRNAAIAAQQRLKAKGITGFVTEMEKP